MRVMDGCHGEESHELLSAVCVCVSERQTAALFLNLGSFLGHRRRVPDAKSVLVGRELNYAAL